MSELPTELVPLTTEQRDIVDLCRAFAREEIRPRARAVDEADTETPWDLWRKAAKAGITGFMLPEEYGGGGFTDVFTQCLVQEELCVGRRGHRQPAHLQRFLRRPACSSSAARSRRGAGCAA